MPQPSSGVLLEDIRLRLEGVRDASRRSRLTFLVMSIASATVILAAWNAYLSWYRAFALQPDFAKNLVTHAAQIELLDKWVDSQVVSISLLGIQIGVSDLAFVGSTGLFVVAGWFFYSMRKENHFVGVLLRDTRGSSPDVRRLVYHGVLSNFVFLTVTEDDEPIKDLDAPPAGGRRIRGLRSAVKQLIYLPVYATLFVVGMDVLTVWWLKAAFREGHCALAHTLDPSDWFKFIVMEAIALTFCWFTYVLSKRSNEMGDATRSLLVAYRRLSASPISPGATGTTEPADAQTDRPQPP